MATVCLLTGCGSGRISNLVVLLLSLEDSSAADECHTEFTHTDVFIHNQS